MYSDNVLDVTKIEPSLKHSTIFERLEALSAGESLTLHNDHDPKPLYYQLSHEYPGEFDWIYQEEGPSLWKVKISKKESTSNTSDDTVGAIAAQDYRKAEVFKNYGIDFCCGGEKPLKEVCQEMEISEAELRNALNEAVRNSNGPSQNYNKWQPGFLADFIANTHHQYTREVGETLDGLAKKVAHHHGENHPELLEVSKRVTAIFKDLAEHMNNEEEYLFPKIKKMSEGEVQPTVLKDLIEEMHKDHDHTGDDVKTIRKITNNYTLPDDACNSYRFLFDKLKEFEDDLFRHIHLENNILFPKVLAQEKQSA